MIDRTNPLPCRNYATNIEYFSIFLAMMDFYYKTKNPIKYRVFDFPKNPHLKTKS